MKICEWVLNHPPPPLSPLVLSVYFKLPMPISTILPTSNPTTTSLSPLLTRQNPLHTYTSPTHNPENPLYTYISTILPTSNPTTTPHTPTHQPQTQLPPTSQPSVNFCNKDTTKTLDTHKKSCYNKGTEVNASHLKE